MRLEKQKQFTITKKGIIKVKSDKTHTKKIKKSTN